VLPIKEVCGGEGLVEKCLPSSLYLAMMIIMYLALDLPQGHLQGCGLQGRGTVQMFLVKSRGQSHRELWSEDWWAWSEHEVHGA
jgi:hypothetical protein